MKTCEKCQVSFSTNRKICPFCSEPLKKLEEEGNVDRYPPFQLPSYKTNFLYKLFVFLAVSGMVISTLVNFFTRQPGDRIWALYVIAIVLYLWFLVKKTILSTVNVARRFVFQSIVLVIVAYLIDWLSSSTGWSLTYLAPFLTVASTLTIVIMIMVKKIRFSEDIIYLFMALLLGFVPLLFYFVGITDLLWPALLSSGFSLLIFVGMFVFASKQTRAELKKRFHI